ncbi:group II intron maturase-specific domain-containing protein [Paradesulfitobacterium aromaticivorans]
MPHAQIMEALSKRISDRKVLKLVKGWLTVPVVEPGGPKQGNKSRIGVPQGGVISPLLANIVLHQLDAQWHRPAGPREKYNARLVRYADDLVILARYIGNPIRSEIDRIIGTLGLTFNDKKTKVLNLRGDDSLDFLGYNIRLGHGDINRLHLRPSKKAVKRLKERVRGITSRKRLYCGIEGIINELNPVLRGWKAYFRLSNVSRIFWKLDFFITARFYRTGRKTSQRLSKAFKPGVFTTLEEKGLYNLVKG